MSFKKNKGSLRRKKKERYKSLEIYKKRLQIDKLILMHLGPKEVLKKRKEMQEKEKNLKMKKELDF